MDLLNLKLKHMLLTVFTFTQACYEHSYFTILLMLGWSAVTSCILGW